MKKRIFIFSLLLASLPNIVLAKEYKDIDQHWAKEYIEEIDQLQVINGYQDDTFRPDENLKKSHIYKIVNRIFHLNDKDQTSFSSLNQEIWYLDELKIAAKAKYIESSDYFQDQDISRIDFLNILGYLYDLEDKDEDYKYFTDIDKIPKKSKQYIGKMLKDGVISGFDSFEFKPYDSITRAEASKIVDLAVKQYGREIKRRDEKSLKEVLEDKDNQIDENLVEKLNKIIEEVENLDLNRFENKAVVELNAKILAAKQVLNKDYTNQDLEKAIQDIEDAKKDLIYINKDARLYIRAENAQGRSINASFTINKVKFNSGDSLASGKYLLEARTPSNELASTYVIMGNEDKTITINFEEEDIRENTGLKLTLGPNLSSPKGTIFNKNDRVEIEVQSPPGKEVDYLLVNGKRKEVLSDSFIFLIKEDTEVEAFFKDIEEDE